METRRRLREGSCHPRAEEFTTNMASRTMEGFEQKLYVSHSNEHVPVGCGQLLLCRIREVTQLLTQTSSHSYGL